MATILLIRLVIEGPSEGDAIHMVDELLDEGVLQDALNEALRHEELEAGLACDEPGKTRVTSATVFADRGAEQIAAMERMAGPLSADDEPIELAPLDDETIARLLSKDDE